MTEQDRTTLKEGLSAVQKELADVDARISQLESEIAAFDPATLPKKKMRLIANRFIWMLSLPFMITALILLITHDYSYYLIWVFFGIAMGFVVLEFIVSPRDFLKTCKKMNVNCTIFSSVYTKIQDAISERQKELDSLKEKREDLSLKIHEYETRIRLM